MKKKVPMSAIPLHKLRVQKGPHKASPVLMQNQKDLGALLRKIESIRKQVRELPSFKGKAALMDKAIASWNQTEYLRNSLAAEIRAQEYGERIRP